LPRLLFALESFRFPSRKYDCSPFSHCYYPELSAMNCFS
jgi:hypothetical protein